MDRMNGLINMTGLFSIICMIIVMAVFWRKQSKLMHKLHKPLTAFAGVLTVIHTVASLTAVKAIDVNMLLVIGSGLLAFVGFIMSVFTLMQKKKTRAVLVKQHIIYSFVSLGICVIHMVLSETII